MIKKNLLLSAAFILCHLSYGQFIKEIRAGVSYAQMHFDDASLQEASSGRIGYFAGITAQQQLSQKLFFRQELVYGVKGHMQRFASSERTARVSYHYLTLPLLLGYKPTSKLSLYLGTELALLGSVRARNDGRSIRLRVLEDYNNFDIAAAAGLTYQLLPRAAVDIRYSHGFRNVRNVQFYNSSGSYEQTKEDGKHRVLQLGLNYTLRKS